MTTDLATRVTGAMTTGDGVKLGTTLADLWAEYRATVAALDAARAEVDLLRHRDGPEVVRNYAAGVLARAEAAEARATQAEDDARRLRRVITEHLMDPGTGHLRTCGGACDDDCRDIRAALAGKEGPPTFDLVAHLHRQREFSERTFGPGPRTKGVLDHIRKELGEVEKDPADLEEWVDVVLLALDGAWRAGHEPEDIAAGIKAKQAKNEARKWPDWRTADRDKAIEHDRTAGKEGP